VCLFAVLAFSSADAGARPVDPTTRPTRRAIDGPHVRGVSPRMSRLIEHATQRSRTFASLVEALEATDVIVHVEEVPKLATGVDGRLMFVHGGRGVRYLRAQVLTGRNAAETMAVVGHELQHALEVALHADVRDDRAFAALYARIGDRPGHPDRYDTAAAREAGRRVRQEMS
jgi:hypothetical protein